MDSSLLYRFRRFWRLAVLGITSQFLQSPAYTQSLPAGFVSSVLQSGYDTPMGTVFSADYKQLFVWEKSGKVWVSLWNGTQYVKQATPVLDISEEVGNWRDFGLASICLDPNFAQNGLLYLFYMVDRHHLLYNGTAKYNPATNEYYNATISRVTRYQVKTANTTLTADPATRFVLLGESKTTGVPLTHESHAGGTILFGRDGTLLVSTGDNASYSSIDKGSASETYWQTALNEGIIRPAENVGAFRAQMLTSLCGKILRLDPNTGDGVASNPFYDGSAPRSAKSRVWTLGFRNPYRMALQPGTGSTNVADANPGTLLVGDVGMNTFEDMHIIRQPGENAGWPIFEGQTTHANYVAAASTLENRDEPNLVNTCTKPYFTFADLLKQAVYDPNGIATVLNPCNGQPLAGLQRRYFHARPALDWQHGSEVARYPAFSGSTPIAVNLGSTGATVAGAAFRGNCSTGGVYCDDVRFPMAYRTVYFFADYGANWIKAAVLQPGTNQLTAVKEFAPAGFCKGVVHVGYNKLDGSLLYVNINTGEIMRISYGGNQPPVAKLTASQQSSSGPGVTFQFTGDQSVEPDGDVLTYNWDFGDGSTATVANPTHVFFASQPQSFTVTLTVKDPQGLSSSNQTIIALGNTVPVVAITNPLTNALYPLDGPTNYTLTARVTDDNATGLTYAWQVVLRHNNHEHREPIVTDASPVVTISPVGCDGETYYYLIRLTVTDQGGLTATDSVKIYPDCNSPKLGITSLAVTPQDGQVVLNWTNPALSFDQVLIATKAGSGFADRPTANTTYIADANFGGGGSPFYGGKVVFLGNGSSTSMVVTGLTNGTTYYFRVYTGKGTAWTGGIEASPTPTGSTPVVPPPTVFDATKCYRLTARVSGKAMEVDNGSTTDGAGIKQRSYASKAWQQWKFQSAGSGYYQLAAVHSGKVIDVSGASTADLATVVQWPANGGANQHWQPTKNTEGYYTLMAQHSGKLLDVKNSSTVEGNDIIQYTANGTQAQQWSIDEVGCVSPMASITLDPTKCYRLTARVSGRVLEINNGSTSNGAGAKQRTYTGKAWQQWKFQATTNGYYRMAALHTGKVLDVYAASTADNTPLVQWPTNGGSNQQWLPKPTADGYYTLSVKHSGKLLSVKNASQNEAADVVQFGANSSTAQQWKLDEVGCVLTTGRLSADAIAETETYETRMPEGEPFTVYPNPAHDWLNIDLRMANGNRVQLHVSDLSGRTLQEIVVEKATTDPYHLDTRAIPAGLYLLQIQAAGLPPVTRKVLIVR